MDHITLTLFGPGRWISELGKETTENIFSVRNLKKEDKILSLVHPSRYPEKIQSLLYSLYLGSHVILNISKVDRELGELLVAIDLMEKNRGWISVEEESINYKLESVLGDNPVNGYERIDSNPALIRDRLLGLDIKRRDTDTLLIVDQAFPVKGIGCVALGFVHSGIIRKYQELTVLPGGMTTQIRSIQIQDEEYEDAPAGSRVGVALKNLDPESIPRGSVLTPNPEKIIVDNIVTVRFRIPSLFDIELKKGMRFHLQSSLQMVPCEIIDVDDPEDSEGYLFQEMELKTDSPIWMRVDHQLGLCYLDSRNFRLFGTGVILL